MVSRKIETSHWQLYMFTRQNKWHSIRKIIGEVVVHEQLSTVDGRIDMDHPFSFRMPMNMFCSFLVIYNHVFRVCDAGVGRGVCVSGCVVIVLHNVVNSL